MTLCKIVDEGDCRSYNDKKFFSSVRGFHTSAMSYALQNLPVTDPLLRNASFLNFEIKEKSNFSEVEYFAKRYSDHYNNLFIYLYRFSNMLPFKAPKELDALLE